MGKKKLSPGFQARIGVPNLGQERDSHGRLGGRRAEVGRAVATELLNDPVYRKALRERLIAGVAGPIEVYLWRKAFGDPEKDDSEREAQAAKFDEIRREVRAFMQGNAEEARRLNAVVTRAPRLLPIPRLPLPEPEPITVDGVPPDDEDAKRSG